MNGCMCGCGCRGQHSGGASWPAREDRLQRLEGYQRDLEQQMAAVAEEIRELREGPQPAS